MFSYDSSLRTYRSSGIGPILLFSYTYILLSIYSCKVERAFSSDCFSVKIFGVSGSVYSGIDSLTGIVFSTVGTLFSIIADSVSTSFSISVSNFMIKARKDSSKFRSEMNTIENKQKLIELLEKYFENI